MYIQNCLQNGSVYSKNFSRFSSFFGKPKKSLILSNIPSIFANVVVTAVKVGLTSIFSWLTRATINHELGLALIACVKKSVSAHLTFWKEPKFFGIQNSILHNSFHRAGILRAQQKKTCFTFHYFTLHFDHIVEKGFDKIFVTFEQK